MIDFNSHEGARAARACLLSLCASCDGARSNDRKGFSKIDVAPGRRLAFKETWTDLDKADVATLLWKYHKQLGLDVDTLPRVPPRKDRRLITILGEKWVVTFPYSQKDFQPQGQEQSLIDAIRTLPVRRWNDSERQWEGPMTPINCRELLRIAEAYEFSLWGGVEEGLLIAASKTTEPQGNTEEGNLRTIAVYEIAGIPFMGATFPYDALTVAEFKACRAKWSPDDRRWYLKFSMVAARAFLRYGEENGFDCSGLREYMAPIIALQEAEQARIEAEKAAKQQEIAWRLSLIEKYTKSHPEPLEGPEKRVLKPFQREGAKMLITNERSILADGMGLGKTTQALVAAKAYPDKAIFVLAPVTLKTNWLREAEECNISIEVHSWGSVPPPPKETPYILIVDEAHFAQSERSMRTKAMLALAKEASAVMLLTGTPMKNGDISNLWPLLVAINHPLSASRREFNKKFTKSVSKLSKYDLTGQTHLNELHLELKGSMIRRLKSQVARDLPPKTRCLVPVQPTDAELATYMAKLRKMQEEYYERVDSGEISQLGEALVFLGHMRRAGSWAKISAAVNLATDILDEGESVVIVTEYRETAELLTEALADYSVVLITGAVRKDRQDIVDVFQRKEARVCIMTSAGGVGITLTAASHVILLDRAWTPGDNEQREDRLHRMTQINSVTCHWLQLPPEIGLDVKIDNILVAKQERIDLVLRGRRKSFRGIQSIGEVAEDLLEDFFGQAPQPSHALISQHSSDTDDEECL